MGYPRNPWRSALAGLFVLLPSIWVAPAAAQKVTVGQTAAVVRLVEGKYQSEVRTLAASNQVFQNESIITKADSAAKVKFSDDTILTVGPDSTVTLDAFVYDPSTKNSKMVVNTAVGVARFVTGRMGSPAYTIKTPTATIGVRGTVLTVSVEDNGDTSVVVEDGAAFVQGETGDPVDVPEGMASNIPDGGEASDPAPPSPDDASGVADMDVTLMLEGGEEGNNESVDDEGLQEITQETEQLREQGCGC